MARRVDALPLPPTCVEQVGPGIHWRISAKKKPGPEITQSQGFWDTNRVQPDPVALKRGSPGKYFSTEFQIRESLMLPKQAKIKKSTGSVEPKTRCL